MYSCIFILFLSLFMVVFCSKEFVGLFLKVKSKASGPSVKDSFSKFEKMYMIFNLLVSIFSIVVLVWFITLYVSNVKNDTIVYSAESITTSFMSKKELADFNRKLEWHDAAVFFYNNLPKWLIGRVGKLPYLTI